MIYSQSFQSFEVKSRSCPAYEDDIVISVLDKPHSNQLVRKTDRSDISSYFDLRKLRGGGVVIFPTAFTDVIPTVQRKSLPIYASDASCYVDPLREKANTILKQMYSQVANDAISLGNMFEEVETAFANKNLALVNAILAELDPFRVKRIIAVGLLRSTYRARGKLTNWRSCLVKVSEMLDNQHQDTTKLLRGLIDTNDRIAFTTRQTLF